MAGIDNAVCGINHAYGLELGRELSKRGGWKGGYVCRHNGGNYHIPHRLGMVFKMKGAPIFNYL